MNEGNVDAPSELYQGDEFDARELWGVFWAGRKVVSVVVLLFAACSALVAFSLTEIYRAEVLLAPAENRGSSNPIGSQFGDAATLFGVNIGSRVSNRTAGAIAVLQSREFINQFIVDHGILVELFAGVWDKESGELRIDQSIYDSEQSAWLRKGGRPTPLEAYRKISEALSVEQDLSSSLVTVTFEWDSPVLASRWVNLMVDEVNNRIRTKDIEEARSAIEFLRKQIQETQLVEMQRVLYSLIESQTRIIMLADVREDYVFQVIDPAVVPDRKISPARFQIIAISTLLGLVLVTFSLFLRHALVVSRDPSSD